MVLNDKAILSRFESLFPRGANKTQVNPNSVDLRIAKGAKILRPGYEWVYGEDCSEGWAGAQVFRSTDGNDYYRLMPGQFLLADTLEWVSIPRTLCGQLFLKSSLARCGVNHMLAGVIDAGFEGTITLELVNQGIGTVYIPIGARVCQLVLYELISASGLPYGVRETSRYFRQQGATPARAEQKF